MKPNVLCVGFAKCGTTTLYDIMKQHPEIYLSNIKEPIYYGDKELCNRGFAWYLKRYYPKKVQEKIIMEINPIIGRDVPAKKIFEDFGKNIKIIFMIRNPIDRLYSEFKMNLVDGTCFENVKDNFSDSTSKLFQKWVDINFKKINNSVIRSKKYSTDFCDSGEYYEKIKDYIEIFGKNNVKIIFFEDFVKDQKKVCEDIYKFINVSSLNNFNYNIHSNNGDRIPRNKITIKLNEIWFIKIYKGFIIKKVPFVSNGFCKVINKITWKMPIILSKRNKNKEKVDYNTSKVIFDYYKSMIHRLEKLININLIKKWDLEKYEEEV